MKLLTKKTEPAFFIVAHFFQLYLCRVVLVGAAVLLLLPVHGLIVPELLLTLLLLVVIRALVVRVNGRLRRLERIAASAVPVV